MSEYKSDRMTDGKPYHMSVGVPKHISGRMSDGKLDHMSVGMPKMCQIECQMKCKMPDRILKFMSMSAIICKMEY